MRATVVGLDPGFRNCGFAQIKLGSEEGIDKIELVQLGVITTQASDKKLNVMQCSDNVRCTRELYGELKEVLKDAHIVCAESMSFPRNSSSAAKVAMCWGVIIALAERYGAVMLQRSPQEVKCAIVGRKSAGKEQVQEVLDRHFRKAQALLKLVPAGRQEHAYDALAAAVSCLRSDEVRLLTSRLE